MNITLDQFYGSIDDKLYSGGTLYLTLKGIVDFWAEKEWKGGDPEKINYMCTRISQMARDQADIFMSFPASNKEIREKFKRFDEELKKRNLKVYEQTGTYSGMLRLLRKTRFLGYRWIMDISKKRNKTTES